MTTRERLHYIGACALLGRASRLIDDPELLDAIECALKDCAQSCEGVQMIRVVRGWRLETL